ncbi:hypothetical protein R1sor_000772 [Riccia sorocarpa]|uniref:Endonuclease/exonuclease/phosphatase domain-containing protein n=1 Tax=Riccia sorocarpa TaxID=122646 RepID=A0ABD3GXA1_9MARC
MRIKERDTNYALERLAEGGKFVVDYTIEGKAGAAVIIRKNWAEVERGVKGDGAVAWIKVRTEMGVVGFASIHGPRDRSKRARVWKWIKETCTEGMWVFGGDWNSVENFEDSVGDSAIQRGAEQRRWTSLMAELDLGDGWNEAAQQRGPHFTRQKLVGNRLDQARLDRVYFTRTEAWNGRRICVHHDDTVRLSDHHPAKIARLQQLLREMARGRATVPDEELRELEKDVKVLETEQRKKWRRLSKIQWMNEGDAPSRFFFAVLKARRAREEINLLIKEDGHRVEDDNQILQELHSYYSALYKQDPISIEVEALRKQVLENSKMQISRQQNERLVERPEEEEIGNVIRDLKNEKSPGIDGMTAEVLKVLWKEARQDVIDFVQSFWETEKLTWKQQTGVIKLTPKEGDRQKIKNWRPLTMLNSGYKLVSKIMANRMGVVMPSLVSNQRRAS